MTAVNRSADQQFKQQPQQQQKPFFESKGQQMGQQGQQMGQQGQQRTQQRVQQVGTTQKGQQETNPFESEEERLADQGNRESEEEEYDRFAGIDEVVGKQQQGGREQQGTTTQQQGRQQMNYPQQQTGIQQRGQQEHYTGMPQYDLPTTSVGAKTYPEQQDDTQQKYPQGVPDTVGTQRSLGNQQNRAQAQGGRGRGGTRGGLGRPQLQERPNRPMPLGIEKRRELIAKHPKTLKDVFSLQPVEEIAFQNYKVKRPILISETGLAERALNRISRHNIHIIPVLASDQSGIIGTIDVLDIIHAYQNTADKDTSQPIQQRMRREFMNMHAKDLMALKTWVCSSKSVLLNVVRGMVKLNQDRFVIVDRAVEGDVGEIQPPEKDVDGVITVSDVLKFLVANSMRMSEEPLFKRSLRDLGLGRTQPKAINHKMIVGDAFKEISRHSCEGFAVVDDNGKLVGNLSACDLKGITRFNCPILNSTVEEFLLRDQKREWFYLPLTIDLNDSLYHAVHQFVSLGKSRFYVQDGDCKPIGEVSRHDILNQLWQVLQ